MINTKKYKLANGKIITAEEISDAVSSLEEMVGATEVILNTDIAINTNNVNIANNATDIDNLELEQTTQNTNIATNTTNIATVTSDLSTHEADTNNPHSITPVQIGLDNVDNTSDLDKPVSTAQQTEIDTKADLVHTHVAADITNFDVEVSNNTDVIANIAKVSADGSIDTHSDVDTTTVTPLIGETLTWDGTNWVPGEVVTTDAVTDVALGSTLGLQQELLANAGQPGLTVLAVGFTNTGKVQGTSLGDGNVIEVYASGDDFNNGIVLYREFMSMGEPICFTGLSNGAIITSTEGFYGMSEMAAGSNESPMPLLSYGLSFKESFFFAFRNSTIFNDGPTQNSQAGKINIVNGPLESVVSVTFGDGTPFQSQSDITMAPWEHRIFGTQGNVEYKITASNPVMACTFSHTTFLDSRLIMPLTNDGITYPRSGQVSALYEDTVVEWFTRDNVQGSLNSGLGVSPGSPIDFDAAPPLGTGATDTDYEPNGATRVFASGLISAYSGADSAGGEATPLMPTRAMSQVVAQPFYIADIGDGGNSGIAIASPYEGEAKIYSWDDTTSSLILEYTIPLTRNGVTVTSKEDQKHPAAGGVANNEVATYPVQLVGNLNAGIIIADVPVTVIAQNGTQTLQPTLRSQNGTTTNSIQNDDDETLMLGITPETLAVEIREGSDGILYKRVIGPGGIDTWVVA